VSENARIININYQAETETFSDALNIERNQGMTYSGAAMRTDSPALPAFRITNIRERGGPTRTSIRPTLIELPAQLEGITDDCYYPDMVQVKYRGEWYLIARTCLNPGTVLHPGKAATACGR
jgi:hypothetical protein